MSETNSEITTETHSEAHSELPSELPSELRENFATPRIFRPCQRLKATFLTNPPRLDGVPLTFLLIALMFFSSFAFWND